MKSKKKTEPTAYKGITTAEVVKRFRISRMQLWRFMRDGLLYTKDERGRLIFDSADVERWRLEHSHPGNLLNAEAMTADKGMGTTARQSFSINHGGSTLERVRQLEVELFRAIPADGPLPIAAVRDWLSTVSLLVDVEQGRLKNDEAHREIRASMFDHAAKAIEDWKQGILPMLDSMPTALSVRVNPTNPALAEGALRTWKDGQLLPMLARPLDNEQTPIDQKG